MRPEINNWYSADYLVTIIGRPIIVQSIIGAPLQISNVRKAQHLREMHKHEYKATNICGVTCYSSLMSALTPQDVGSLQ